MATMSDGMADGSEKAGPASRAAIPADVLGWPPDQIQVQHAL